MFLEGMVFLLFLNTHDLHQTLVKVCSFERARNTDQKVSLQFTRTGLESRDNSLLFFDRRFFGCVGFGISLNKRARVKLKNCVWSL